MAEDVELIKSTMTADDIAVLKQMLARIEGKLDQVLDLVSENAMDAEPAEPEQEADDDFVDTWTAAQRSNLPVDTIRWLCREKGMGRKRGKLWLVSVPALRCYLERRSRLP
ncbi:hypothetical protein ACC676_36185 [Rhizobium ruizarguesonis]